MSAIIKNGIVYNSGKDNSKTISYEDYMKLSEEEKNSDTITYYIPDYPGIEEQTNMRYDEENDMVQIFRNGSWENWKRARFLDTYLFNNGDITNITGGWDFINSDTATKGIVTVGNTLDVYITDNNAGEISQHSPKVITKNKINVEDFSKAIITVSSYKNSSGSSSSNFSVSAIREPIFTTEYIASSKAYSNQATVSNFTIELDLTNVNGFVYFAICNYYSSVYISKIQLV